jgi:hypothetical protein
MRRDRYTSAIGLSLRLYDSDTVGIVSQTYIIDNEGKVLPFKFATTYTSTVARTATMLDCRETSLATFTGVDLGKMALSECSKAFLALEGRVGQGKAYAAVVAGATTRLNKSAYRKGCHEPDPA